MLTEHNHVSNPIEGYLQPSIPCHPSQHVTHQQSQYSSHHVKQHEIQNQITDYKFLVLYVKSLIETESQIKVFENQVTDLINYLFERCELATSGPAIFAQESNVLYNQIIGLSRHLIQIEYNDIFYDNKRIFVFDSIISRILKHHDDTFIANTFINLERNVTHPYSRIYKCIIQNHNLKSYDFRYDVMKNLLCRIIESQARELTQSNNFKTISDMMDKIKISLGADCDKLFNNDFPIPRWWLVNPNDNVFDAMDLITQLAIIGCTDSIKILLEEMKKTNDIEYIQIVANVALRYNNKQCYYALINLTQESHIFGHDFIPDSDIELQKLDHAGSDNKIKHRHYPLIVDNYNYNAKSGVSHLTGPSFGQRTTLSLDSDGTDTPYVKMRDDMNTDKSNEYFDINLPCISYRVYYSSENPQDAKECTLF